MRQDCLRPAKEALIRLRLQVSLVDITPTPALAALDRAHHRVLGLNEMPGCVLARGGIAATHVPTDQAHAEMNPPSAGFEAFFASLGVGLHFLDQVEVGTCGSHTG